jgi:hypothetical protein
MLKTSKSMIDKYRLESMLTNAFLLFVCFILEENDLGRTGKILFYGDISKDSVLLFNCPQILLYMYCTIT